MVSSPSPEDSSLSSLSQSAEEEEEENNEKSSSPKHAEGDDSPKKSQTGKVLLAKNKTSFHFKFTSLPSSLTTSVFFRLTSFPRNHALVLLTTILVR